MTDAVSVTIAPAPDLLALDLWDGALPDLGGVRALQVEPARWWLIDAGDRVDAIATALGDRGALTPFGGGMVRASLRGTGWRDLLSVSGLFDTFHPDFGPGRVVSTVIHHVAVRIAVTTETSCEVFYAASYAATLISLWRNAGTTVFEG